jgi:hypothetical protein
VEDIVHTELNVFELPIERIKKTCDLMGVDFDEKLPELETYLEGLVANGETNVDRLTVSGLAFLKGNAK